MDKPTIDNIKQLKKNIQTKMRIHKKKVSIKASKCKVNIITKDDYDNFL
jgi:hypothetical protein